MASLLRTHKLSSDVKKYQQRDSRVPSYGNELSTYNSDDDLQMPNSNGESEVRLRFKPFRHEDINNPRFRVGMMLEIVVQLRMVVTKYSIKERVEIKLPWNKKKKYEADGYKWYIYALVDSRAKGMVIEKYNGENTCKRK
jgi:hypothetical protein